MGVTRVKRNKLVILVGPSASGKTTYGDRLKASGVAQQILTTTTRAPRVGEVAGVDMYYTDVASFQNDLANGEFIVNTLYAGNYYGMRASTILELLSQGDVFAIVDQAGVEGFKEMVKRFNLDIDVEVWVFTLPRSVAAGRMARRGDTTEAIDSRLAQYEEELAAIVREYGISFDNTYDGFVKGEEVLVREGIKREPYLLFNELVGERAVIFKYGLDFDSVGNYTGSVFKDYEVMVAN